MYSQRVHHIGQRIKHVVYTLTHWAVSLKCAIFTLRHTGWPKSISLLNYHYIALKAVDLSSVFVVFDVKPRIRM